jgi:hypothetical protein
MGNGYLLNSQDFKDTWGVCVEKTSGFLDLPKRKGQTEQGWDDEDGIEAFTDSDDIYFEARDLILYCFITADSISDLKTNFDSFKAELIQSGEQTLYNPKTETTHTIYFKDGIAISEQHLNGKYVLKFTLILREPEVTRPT